MNNFLSFVTIFIVSLQIVKNANDFTKILKKVIQNKMVERKIKNRDVAERFGVSLQTIRNARKGITKSDLADKIREETTVLLETIMEEKKIKMTVHGRVGEMARLFGVTRELIRKALNLERNSSKCKSIRKYALENGGIEY